MSLGGACGVFWDNAWAESCNAMLKNDGVHKMVYPAKDKAVNDTASRIKCGYNYIRLHLVLEYRIPNEVGVRTPGLN